MPNTFSRSPLHLPHALRPRWVKRPGDLVLWPFDRQNGVRVTCDLGYLCANFGLPRPLFSQLSPDVRDRHTSDRNQTSDVRQKHLLIPPPIRRGGIKTTHLDSQTLSFLLTIDNFIGLRWRLSVVYSGAFTFVERFPAKNSEIFPSLPEL